MSLITITTKWKGVHCQKNVAVQRTHTAWSHQIHAFCIFCQTALQLVPCSCLLLSKPPRFPLSPVERNRFFWGTIYLTVKLTSKIHHRNKVLKSTISLHQLGKSHGWLAGMYGLLHCGHLSQSKINPAFVISQELVYPWNAPIIEWKVA